LKLGCATAHSTSCCGYSFTSRKSNSTPPKVREDIIERSVGHFRKADLEYGDQVARAVAKHRMLR
jgi:catalase